MHIFDKCTCSYRIWQENTVGICVNICRTCLHSRWAAGHQAPVQLIFYLRCAQIFNIPGICVSHSRSFTCTDLIASELEMGRCGNWLFSASVAFWRCLFTLVRTALSPTENRCVAVQVSGSVRLPTLYKVWPQSYISTCVNGLFALLSRSRRFVGTRLSVHYLGIWGIEALKIWINEEHWLLEHKVLPRVKTPPASELIQLSLAPSSASAHTKTPEEQVIFSRDHAASSTKTCCGEKDGAIRRGAEEPPERWIHYMHFTF